MFGASYVFVYFAEQHLASGLVAVGYSASPLLGMLGQRLFFGTPMTARVAAGSLLGICGIALVFAPEIARSASPRPRARGRDLHGAGGASSRRSAAWRRTAITMPASRSGRTWRSACSTERPSPRPLNLALGHSFAFRRRRPYVVSLLYLAVCGSILAFAGYLTLIGRIGAARASYVGVMVPIIALAVSAAFEGFHWQPLTWAGMTVSLAGNVLVLRNAARR